MCNFFVLQRFYSLALGKNSNTRFSLDQKRFAYTSAVVITLALTANIAASVAAAVLNLKLYLPFFPVNVLSSTISQALPPQL